MKQILEWILGYNSGDLAGDGTWKLGFIADYGNYVKLGLMVVLGLLAFLAIRSYRREGQTPRRTKTILAVIRTLVFVLVLGVLLRPSIVLKFVKTLHSYVVVLVDDSMSMSVADRYADAELRAKTAAALGVSEDELAKMSRSEIARRQLARKDGAIAKLAQEHPVVVMRFSTTQPGNAKEAYTRQVASVNIVKDKPEKTPKAPELPKELELAIQSLRGGGFETKIPAALRDAVELMQGRRVGGVVLVSDGMMTPPGEKDRLSSALQHVNAAFPLVCTVVVGDPTQPRNVYVTALEVTDEVRAGTPAKFTAQIGHRNLAGQSVAVKLERRKFGGDGKWEQVASKDVELVKPAADASAADKELSKGAQSVEFDLEPKETGEWEYRASIDPRSDELNVDDNYSAPELVRVSDEKINVLLISGNGGWEFQYLRSFLLRQPELYRLSCWQQNADPEVNQVASSGMKLAQLPKDLSELIRSQTKDQNHGYDLVILIDPKPNVEGFDRNFVDMLRRFVHDHTGGLCYVAGTKYSEELQKGTSDMQPLLDLMPVTMAANVVNLADKIGERQPEPWPVALTLYGEDHPVMRLMSNPADNQKIWRALPGIYWSHPILKLKPGARALGVNSNPSRRTEKGEPEPVVVVQPYGSGQVLFVGNGDTWRWRFIEEGLYQRKFWANTVRFLATLKARQVVISTGGRDFTIGERINIDADAYDEKFNPRADKTLVVDLINQATGDVQSVTLDAVEGKGGRYRGTIIPQQVGRYKLTALRDDPDAARKVDSKDIKVDLPQAEKLRTEADVETMRTIASKPENAVYAWQMDKLADMIPSGRLQATQVKPRELWDTPLMLGLIVMLLVVEWILRKKHNMA